MEIQCKQPQFFGQKVNLPDVGATEIDENGIAEVPEEVAALLCDGKLWVNPSAPVEVKQPAQETTATDTPVDENKVESADPTSAEILASLDSMGLEELKGIAEGANIKGWKLLKNKEAALRNLIKNQLTKQG